MVRFHLQRIEWECSEEAEQLCLLKGRFVILPFLLLVSLPFLFPHDAFLYSLFPPKCSQGQVFNPPFPSHFASASSFLPSSYFSSKNINVFTWKVQERNRMWKLCASARDPWRQHHPHLWHPLLQSPLQVIFCALIMYGFDLKFHNEDQQKFAHYHFVI